MSKEFKKLILTIDGGNAAFGESPEEALSEVVRIITEQVVPFLGGDHPLGGAAKQWGLTGLDADGHPEGLSVACVNGNTVGRIEVEYETTFDHDAEIDF